MDFLSTIVMKEQLIAWFAVPFTVDCDNSPTSDNISGQQSKIYYNMTKQLSMLTMSTEISFDALFML